MSEATFERPRPLVTAIWALALAGTLALAVWLFMRYAGGLTRFGEYLAMPRVLDWVVLGLATCFFYWLDYARFYTLLAILGHRIPWGVGVRLTCVSYFVSNLTPFAELHYPAMVWLLHREGVPASKAAAVTMVKSLYMILWICLIAGIALSLSSDAHLPPRVVAFLPLSIATLAVLVVMMLVPIFFARRLQAWHERRQGGKPTIWMKLAGGMVKVAGALSTLGRSRQWMHLGCHAASVAFVLTYCFVGFWLCRALGVPQPPMRALAVFSGGLLVAYLAPVPGAIGVTEAATSYLIDPAMTPAGMAVAVLQRCLCWYGVGPIGAVMLLTMLRRGRRGRDPQPAG